MKSRGWSQRSREEVTINGLPGILVHFEQPAGDQVFLKWSFVFGDEKKTTMVTATFPKERELTLSARLKAAVLSGAISEITVGLRCPVSSPILGAFGRNSERISRMDSHHGWPLAARSTDVSR
jgi:hypothetical protein